MECMMPRCPVIAERDGMCEHHRRAVDIPDQVLRDYIAREHNNHQRCLDEGVYERMSQPVKLSDAARELLPQLTVAMNSVADKFQAFGEAASSLDGWHEVGALSEEGIKMAWDE